MKLQSCFIILQKEWLEAFDLAKKLKMKKQDDIASTENQEQPNSYNEAFNRMFLYEFIDVVC